MFKWSFGDINNKNNLAKKREILLLIALKCPHFKIDHLIDNIDDLIELIQKDTPISKLML